MADPKVIVIKNGVQSAPVQVKNTITTTTALKALQTTTLTVPSLIHAATATGGQLNIWLLRAGTDAEDEPAGILRPDDYAATTNEKILEKWS